VATGQRANVPTATGQRQTSDGISTTTPSTTTTTNAATKKAKKTGKSSPKQTPTPRKKFHFPWPAARVGAL